MRWMRALGALAVLVLLAGGVPWLLARGVGNPWPAEGISWDAPLTDGAILGLLAVVVWILWAQLLVCVVVEAVAAISADRVQLRAPFTLRVQQQFARRLVTAVLVATAATPGLPITGTTTNLTTTTTTTTTTTMAAPATTDEATTWSAVSAELPDPVDPAGSTAANGQDGTQLGGSTRRVVAETVVSEVSVMRLDSLWSIAERVLGDGDRWSQIATLNEGRVMNDGTIFRAADAIKPGWQLRVPHLSHDLPGIGSHVVSAGDTLSGIAEEHLDDGDRWPELYALNRSVIGADPDLIIPGQVITLTNAAQTGTAASADRDLPTTKHEVPKHRTDRVPPQLHTQDVEPHSQEEKQENSDDEAEAGDKVSGSAAPLDPPAEAAGSADADAEEPREEGGVTVLRALLASAGCLAGGALMVIATNRRRQLRERGAGRTIAATPSDLAAVERAVLETGSETMEVAIFVDRALRHLAASQRVAGRALPHVGAAVLDDTAFAVLFTQPVTDPAPEGWTTARDDLAWLLPRTTILEDDLQEQPAPYPALVSVGRDHEQRTWMLDLESSGLFGIAGPAPVVEDMVRFLVAELALNAWAEGAEVMLPRGFAAETVDLNPGRVRIVGDDEAARRAVVVARGADEARENLGMDELDLRRDAVDDTGPVVIVSPGRPESAVANTVSARTRSRVVVLHGCVSGLEHDDHTPSIELDADGTALLTRWGVTVQAFTLPAVQASDMAALVASTTRLEDEPMPLAEESTPIGAFSTADGALREEFTAPREIHGEDSSSLLPGPDQLYLSAAATTPHDLAALAPGVPAEIREQVEASDPTLDEDLAAWRDPECSRPKVQVFGPVEVHAPRTAPRTARGKAHEDARGGGSEQTKVANLGATIEFIVYLTCQERGVTPDRAAEALGWKSTTLHNRARDARKLMGPRPDGEEWLPEAPKSPTARERGIATYELHQEVLVAADLFRRLRLRAQARGANGLDDLVAALSLVTGEPFDQQRRQGYGWLVEGDRLDFHLSHAIVDVSHLVVDRALTSGDTVTARSACEIAIHAVPHDERPRLDLAAVTAAENHGSADNIVADQVLDVVDADPTERTEEILDQRGWLAG